MPPPSLPPPLAPPPCLTNHFSGGKSNCVKGRKFVGHFRYTNHWISDPPPQPAPSLPPQTRRVGDGGRQQVSLRSVEEGACRLKLWRCCNGSWRRLE